MYNCPVRASSGEAAGDSNDVRALVATISPHSLMKSAMMWSPPPCPLVDG